MKHHEITKSLSQRAKQAGFMALFVTLDTYTLGWRPSDMDNGYNLFLRSDSVGVYDLVEAAVGRAGQ